jgi:hypothetical protein
MMSKKNYKKFAQMIKDEFDSLDELPKTASDELQCLVEKMAYLFYEDNPKFSFGKFRKACGVSS